jgi:hypothetical protein
MIDPTPAPLAAWQSFYVLVGTAAAALTGLQFVVIAFIGQAGTAGGEQEISAFGTPTVVHFCAVLLLAAVLAAPWGSLAAVDAAVVLAGAAGLVYAAVVIRRARKTTRYQPVFEDWLWHAVLPVVAYGAVLGGGLAMRGAPVVGLFVLAAGTLLLLFIGIHNAWDTAAYIALQRTAARETTHASAEHTAHAVAALAEPRPVEAPAPAPVRAPADTSVR